jgi:hypothetical protein
MVEEIKREIASAPFVEILLDETTDIASMSQLSAVLGYVTNNGTVEEWFLGFSDVSEDWH